MSNNSLFRFEAWPTEFPPVITQRFGANPDIYRQFYGDGRGHQGLDFRATEGSEIFCVAPGIVKMTYLNPYQRSAGGHNFGIHCRVLHLGCYETIYCHLSYLFAEVGDLVPAGALLGLAGNTGFSFAPHLHLHFKLHGRVLDPTPFVVNLISRLTEEEE